MGIFAFLPAQPGKPGKSRSRQLRPGPDQQGKEQAQPALDVPFCLLPPPGTQPDGRSPETAEARAVMSAATTAYLVVRRSDGFGDVFPLTAGQTCTLGRAPTNRIVLKDDLCSREHAEVT